jgi:hypothetical protein
MYCCLNEVWMCAAVLWGLHRVGKACFSCAHYASGGAHNPAAAAVLLLRLLLQDSLQTAKGPVLPDSSILLLRIQAPALFIQAAGDNKNSTDQMRKVAAQMKPAAVPRLVEVPGVNDHFMSGDPPTLQPEALEAVTKPLVEFVEALGSDQLDSCSLPFANPAGTAAAELSESAAAGIQAQIQLLDADDALVYEVEPLGKPGEAPGGANVAAQQQKAAQAQQQQLLQQHLQLQVLQQQQAQQVQLAAAAAKAGINMQQAAAQRVAAAAAAAAAAAGGSSGKLPGGVSASGAPGVAPIMLPGGFTQITPQMLAAAQAMQLAAAQQGIRPAGGMMVQPGAAAAAGQQQQGAAAGQQPAKGS